MLLAAFDEASVRCGIYLIRYHMRSILRQLYAQVFGFSLNGYYSTKRSKKNTKGIRNNDLHGGERIYPKRSQPETHRFPRARTSSELLTLGNQNCPMNDGDTDRRSSWKVTDVPAQHLNFMSRASIEISKSPVFFRCFLRACALFGSSTWISVAATRRGIIITHLSSRKSEISMYNHPNALLVLHINYTVLIGLRFRKNSAPSHSLPLHLLAAS